MKVIPILALVDQETYDKLRPLVDDLVPRLRNSASDIIKTTMLMSGWDFESMAWGLILRGFTTMEGDLEIEIGDGDTTTIHTLAD
jgi:hypothetical protein